MNTPTRDEINRIRATLRDDLEKLPMRDAAFACVEIGAMLKEIEHDLIAKIRKQS